jgi:hypothetical protein
MPRQTPLLQGTLDLLILEALSLQPLHGSAPRVVWSGSREAPTRLGLDP